MKVKFIGRGSYFASPFHFTEKNRTHKVTKEMGSHLLKNKNFEEILEEKLEEKTKVETEVITQQEVEEKASKEKEKLEKAKKETKKTADKK